MYKTIENPSDLPTRMPHGGTIYLDCEATNITGKGKPKDTMIWHGDQLCGVAFTHDDNPDSYYIPVRHTDGPNLPTDAFRRWLTDVLSKTYAWVNHNIKFDMHLVAKEVDEETRKFDMKIIDTMAQAHIIHNSLPKYGLKELSVQYLGIPNWKDGVKDWLTANKTNNWADVPVEIMAPYACKDVDHNRALHLKFNTLMPEECKPVWEMEQLVTPVLYDLECQGMPIDPDELARESELSLDKQEKLHTELSGLIGHDINVNSDPQRKNLFLEELGLPVVVCTKKGNPSFGADAMGLYEALPEVLSNASLRRTLKAFAALVEEKHFYGLFLKGYTNLHVDGIVHPTFLQNKVTGRMGCKQPNSQQLNKRAKRLVKCLPGHNIWSWDASQIEYRLITHYTKNQKAIQAYRDDVKTDYHIWVAELAKIPRKPAKTLNFLIAFGGGKKKAMEFMAKQDEVIDEVNADVDMLYEECASDSLIFYRGVFFVKENRAGVFEAVFNVKAGDIYDKYFAAQPNLKPTMYSASNVAVSRGYVRTVMHRRSYIPRQLSYKAFNAVIQGSAADIFKERLVAYAPRYNLLVREMGVKPFALVHDDFIAQVPVDLDETQYVEYTTKVLQDVPFKLAVPIIFSKEKHLESWGM